jgi:GTP cyclohydrolase I
MKSVIPDVANHETPAYAKKLDRVGMSDIEVPVRLDSPYGQILTHGKAKAFVSLDDPESKGIHMSRLYLATQSRFEEAVLSPKLFEETLDDFLISHKDLSEGAFLSLEFDLTTKRKALLSENSGWRTYPIKITGKKNQSGKFELLIDIQISYSSTCPCSAALARQLIQEQFGKDFTEKADFSKQEVIDWLGKSTSIMATPHGQRSHANITIIPSEKISESFSFIELIDKAENAIKTPVQTAVKRVDEQEFAKRNGENLMFAEDAARNIAKALDEDSTIADFKLEVIHYESLHNHDAYAMASKGIEGGLKA